MDGDGEHHMTRAEYNANKYAVRAHLQAAKDPFAFRVAAGAERDAAMWPAAGARIAELRKRGDAVELVRGYLVVVTPFLAMHGCEGEMIYSAVPCPVVRVSPADGAPPRHETTCNGLLGGGPGPILFVPSSRMHAELTDEDLLSGAFQLCHVWSVPATMMRQIRALRDTHSAHEQRRWRFSPEEAPAPRTIVVHTGFFLEEYLGSRSSRLSRADFVDVQLAFGMPYMDVPAHARVAASTTMLDRSLECQDALIAPAPPWKHDRDAWLPSVPALHAAIHDTKGLSEGAVCERQHVFFKLFVTLEVEYVRRRYTCMMSASSGKTAKARLAGRGQCGGI